MMQLTEWTVRELREMAREYGIQGISRYNKSDLVSVLHSCILWKKKLSSKKVAELRTLARKHGVKVTAKTPKAELVANLIPILCDKKQSGGGGCVSRSSEAKTQRASNDFSSIENILSPDSTRALRQINKMCTMIGEEVSRTTMLLHAAKKRSKEVMENVQNKLDYIKNVNVKIKELNKAVCANINHIDANKTNAVYTIFLERIRAKKERSVQIKEIEIKLLTSITEYVSSIQQTGGGGCVSCLDKKEEGSKRTSSVRSDSVKTIDEELEEELRQIAEKEGVSFDVDERYMTPEKVLERIQLEIDNEQQGGGSRGRGGPYRRSIL